jgi:hypothetical protein
MRQAGGKHAWNGSLGLKYITRLFDGGWGASGSHYNRIIHESFTEQTVP